MTLPGPGAAALFVDLLLLAVAAVAIGEPIRSLLGRRSSWLAGVDPVERFVVDLYLGGALVYVVAAVPLGLFTPPVVALAAALPWAVRLYLGPSPVAAARATLRAVGAALRTPSYLAVGLVSLTLLAVEVVAAAPVPTGNTYDSSLYSLYTSLLLLHHTLPTSLSPVDAVGLAFPQGPTAWFALGQQIFGFPGIRTSLLVTPLFYALAPPAGFALGRRWWGTPQAGAAVAVVLALLGPFPREIVAGSNDLVLSLPLVLLLAAFARVWSDGRAPGWGDALVFGGLAGYAATLNPVGPDWLFLVVLVTALLASPRLGGAPLAWLSRFLASVAIGVAVVSPTIFVLIEGRSSPGFVPGGATPAAGAPFGTSLAQFVGGIDPFLFRPSDTWLSPFPVLRAELALLIVLGGVVLLLGAYERLPTSRPFARFVLSAGLVAGGIIGAFVLARSHVPGFSDLVYLSSATETSVYLFVIYSVLAAVPLILLLERVGRVHPTVRTGPGPRRAWSPDVDPSIGAALAVVLALVVVLPGAGVTASSLSGQLQGVYEQYSNVTADDVAMLKFAAGAIPAGGRVLVAPGSAAEFLPVYDPNVILLYPMVSNFENVNGSYDLLVQQLTNATLDTDGIAALWDLGVGYVLVTGPSSTLFPPFSPVPFELSVDDRTGASVVYHSGNDWIFQWGAGAAGVAEPEP